MKTIAFLGGKEIGCACLKHLLENSNLLGISVVYAVLNERKILSSDQSSSQHLCRKFSIPVLNSPEEILIQEDVDILLSVQYHQILKPAHIQKAKQIAANLHMAPLPEYRGCNQFSFAIIDKVKEFGATIHRLEEKIDAGDIMFEKRFPVEQNSTVLKLYEKTFTESIQLFKESIGKIIEGNFTLTPQKNLLSSRPTSYHNRHEIEKIKQIDLGWEKEKILRYFRATYFPPFPPPFAMVNGNKIAITPDWLECNL